MTCIAHLDTIILCDWHSCYSQHFVLHQIKVRLEWKLLDRDGLSLDLINIFFYNFPELKRVLEKTNEIKLYHFKDSFVRKS